MKSFTNLRIHIRHIRSIVINFANHRLNCLVCNNMQCVAISVIIFFTLHKDLIYYCDRVYNIVASTSAIQHDTWDTIENSFFFSASFSFVDYWTRKRLNTIQLAPECTFFRTYYNNTWEIAWTEIAFIWNIF